jgi:hypothetical protein
MKAGESAGIQAAVVYLLSLDQRPTPYKEVVYILKPVLLYAARKMSVERKQSICISYYQNPSVLLSDRFSLSSRA